MPGVFIFDPEDSDVGFSLGDDSASGLYLHIETDTLYLTDQANIIEWEGDAVNNMQYQWRSQRIRTERPINLGAGIVEAESYTFVSLKIYAVLENGLTLITTVTVADDEPFRLPGGYLSNLFEVEVISSDRVSRISLGQTVLDLTEG